jgi:hypothetical protein
MCVRRLEDGLTVRGPSPSPGLPGDTSFAITADAAYAAVAVGDAYGTFPGDYTIFRAALPVRPTRAG